MSALSILGPRLFNAIIADRKYGLSGIVVPNMGGGPPTPISRESHSTNLSTSGSRSVSTSTSTSEMNSRENIHASSGLKPDGSGRVILGERARTVLEQGCKDISNWPMPPSSATGGSQFTPITLALSLLQTSFNVMIPPTLRFPQLFVNPDPKLNIIITNPVRLFDFWGLVIESLWGIWEAVMCGESVIVVGGTPKGVSEAIWGLVELIKPVCFYFLFFFPLSLFLSFSLDSFIYIYYIPLNSFIRNVIDTFWRRFSSIFYYTRFRF